MQSLPTSMPRTPAMTELTLAPGNIPPSPGLAPWDSLTSMARTGFASHSSTSRPRSKRPAASRTPKYPVPIWNSRSPPWRWNEDSPPSPVDCQQPASWAPRLSASTAAPDNEP